VRRSLVLAAVALLAAGCGSDTPPEVTFTAGSASVTARPTQYCDLKLTDCAADEAAPVRLAVPAGTALQVEVPDGIAEAPWHVVFSYRNEGGEQIDGRSPLFPADQQQEYTLTLPTTTDRLVAAQVQQFGPAPQINEGTGEIEFPVRGSWVLTATG
jgi:Protein of unknown function (DUF2771)